MDSCRLGLGEESRIPWLTASIRVTVKAEWRIILQKKAGCGRQNNRPHRVFVFFWIQVYDPSYILPIESLSFQSLLIEGHLPTYLWSLSRWPFLTIIPFILLLSLSHIMYHTVLFLDLLVLLMETRGKLPGYEILLLCLLAVRCQTSYINPLSLVSSSLK